ncbi:hypothetical protein AJE_05026 [Alishewanella jeotgali KCTC 22429]|uniref:Uncharacterized protein n=1 Tax=Alishewanella jeotgali KCTC 22429 TaxID=1129374 RepID=H3ZCD2_9ALTE|nr:hypothetical protein AJE_05026 [Alishewanella jeotgali KCTC 22429]
MHGATLTVGKCCFGISRPACPGCGNISFGSYATGRYFQVRRSTDAYYADFICRDQTDNSLFGSKLLLNHAWLRGKRFENI